MAQWLRICLLMQGTWVWALVREEPTCRGATKPVHHNYRAYTLEPVSHNYWAHVTQLLSPWAITTEARVPRACSPQQREATAMRSPRTSTKRSPRSRQLEKARTQQRRPNAATQKKFQAGMEEIIKDLLSTKCSKLFNEPKVAIMMPRNFHRLKKKKWSLTTKIRQKHPNNVNMG